MVLFPSIHMALLPILWLYNMPPHIVPKVGTGIYKLAEEFVYLFLGAVRVYCGKELHHCVLVAYDGGKMEFHFSFSHVSSFIQI